jgi:hypothetical protein
VEQKPEAFALEPVFSILCTSIPRKSLSNINLLHKEYFLYISKSSSTFSTENVHNDI